MTTTVTVQANCNSSLQVEVVSNFANGEKYVERVLQNGETGVFHATDIKGISVSEVVKVAAE